MKKTDKVDLRFKNIFNFKPGTELHYQWFCYRDMYKRIQQYTSGFQQAGDASLIQHSHCELHFFRVFCFFL